jgi:Carboxypeptidase regulatory-like domain
MNPGRAVRSGRARTARTYAQVVLVVSVLALSGCATKTAGPSTPKDSGIRVTGSVKASPACPGPQRINSPCPPTPVAGAPVEMATNGSVVASTTTDATGNFQLTVPAGTYVIRAHNVGYASQVTQMITVTGPMDVPLVVDSGIR